MKIIQVIYPKKGKRTSIQIFSEYFIMKNKNKFKIIYKNKIYPLMREFPVINKTIDKLKIKLISFENNININNIYRENIFIDIIYEKDKKIKNAHKYDIYFKHSMRDIFKMSYKINKYKKEIRLFGEKFIENNKDKCIIIYKGEISFIKEFIFKKDIDLKKQKKIEIILIEIGEITDRSYMFHCCNLLEEFISLKEDRKNINKKKYNIDQEAKKYDEIYSGCVVNNEKNITYDSSEDFSYLTSKLDRTKWAFSNCTNMSNMFSQCTSLISLPDSFSTWYTGDVTDMNSMFCNCTSLISLPDISKWNMNKVTDINLMFFLCSSLTSLPDISEWKMNNITKIKGIFGGCKSLLTLPDISKWNIDNIKI